MTERDRERSRDTQNEGGTAAPTAIPENQTSIDNSSQQKHQQQSQTLQQEDEFKILSQRFNPFLNPPISERLIRPPVHSIPLEHYEISKKPMKLSRHKTQYYIVPVTHNSFQSYNLVNKVTKMMNPDVIAVELSNMEDIEKAKLVAKEQALACQLAEFSGRSLLFMDRPIEFTRHAEKTYWEHSRIRAVVFNLWNDYPISRDDAEYLRFFIKYSLPELLQYVAPVLSKRLQFNHGPKLESGKVNYHEEFNRLLEVGIFDAFYSEREQYMVRKLREIADEAPDRNQVVVAVVGQLHLPHIKFYWERDDLLSVEDLCSFSAPRAVVPIYTFQIYMVMFIGVVLCYRSFMLFRMPAIDRPRLKSNLTYATTAFWAAFQCAPALAMFPAQGTIGLISSGLIYTSYNRLRMWGYRRPTAFAITSLPALGYGAYKAYKMNRNYNRALRRPQ